MFKTRFQNVKKTKCHILIYYVWNLNIYFSFQFHSKLHHSNATSRYGILVSVIFIVFLTEEFYNINSLLCFYRLSYRIYLWTHRRDFSVSFFLFILAGQEKFRAMTPMYYRNANAALLCFDLTNYKSFLDVKDWVQELHKYVVITFSYKNSMKNY